MAWPSPMGKRETNKSFSVAAVVGKRRSGRTASDVMAGAQITTNPDGISQQNEYGQPYAVEGDQPVLEQPFLVVPGSTPRRKSDPVESCRTS